MNCTLWTGSWITCSVVGSNCSGVRRVSGGRRKTSESLSGHRDSEQAGEQVQRAGDGHKGPRLMGKAGPRRWGSGMGCWCVFQLEIRQIRTKSSCRGARRPCQAAVPLQADPQGCMSPPALPWACKPPSPASWAAAAPHEMNSPIGAEQTCRGAMMWEPGTGTAVGHAERGANLQ